MGRAYSNNNNNKAVWKIVSGIDRHVSRDAQRLGSSILHWAHYSASAQGHSRLSRLSPQAMARQASMPRDFLGFLSSQGFSGSWCGFPQMLGLAPLYCRSAIEWHGVQTRWDKIGVKWHEVYFR
jgi:hypothetical protein